jgi:hypothetical protein
MDPYRFRTRVVHGWSFRNLPREETDKIREYLHTGDRSKLPDSYMKLADRLDEGK